MKIVFIQILGMLKNKKVGKKTGKVKFNPHPTHESRYFFNGQLDPNLKVHINLLAAADRVNLPNTERTSQPRWLRHRKNSQCQFNGFVSDNARHVNFHIPWHLLIIVSRFETFVHLEFEISIVL